MKRLLFTFLLCLLPLCASAGKPKPPPPDAVKWTKLATVQNDGNNYTPVVLMGGSQIRVYANNNAATGIAGDYWLQVGSWASLGSPSLALHNTDPRDTFIRTSAVARGASGNYYALLYTGDGYPTQGGYSPSWATSPDGMAWTWAGPIGLFGRNQSSAANLIVDEARTDDYACMAWLDLAGLVLMHAPLPCAPEQWTSDGIDVWPIAEVPQFVAAVQTPYGYHLIGANYWDGSTARSLRHAFSCTGLPPWHVIETASDVGVGTAKGTNLAYDPATNLIHALTSGQHFTLAAKNFGC